jgi:hypothetical protein
VEATATSIAIINKGQRITHAAPETILHAVECKVWTWVVSSEEFAQLKQAHLISNTARRSDGVHVRVVADQQPNRDAQPADANLEDAYLYFVQSSRVQ